MDKLDTLLDTLKTYKEAVVAFSGGVDSALLLAAAKMALGAEHVIAVTIKGAMTGEDQHMEATAFAEELGIALFTVEVDVFQMEAFVNNRRDRCYYCKKKIFEAILEEGKRQGYSVILEGSNVDDSYHYRPGHKAMEELGIRSPLALCGFSKKEIRECAKDLGLSVSQKPSDSCLATRFPYDMPVNQELFSKVEKAEKKVKSLGISTCRVRVQTGMIARIELEKKDWDKLIHREDIIGEIKELGFCYITLDLEGFRSGSMDEGRL